MQIDVVIPCYNYAHYLRQCVGSVLDQEGVDVRVLIIDDCSPDHTPEVGRALANEDCRVEYRRHASNLRHIATYNEGLLEWASGDAVALLSADDLLAAGSLRRAAELLEARPEIGLVHGRQQLFENEPKVTSPTKPLHKNTVLSGQTFVESCCAAAHNPVATPTAVVRTKVQHAVGGYSASLPHTADMELWLRIAARSAVGYIDALQAFKRIHNGNMQHLYLASAMRDIGERHQTFCSFFHTCGQLIHDAERLRVLANRTLAAEAFWAASRAFDSCDEHGCRQCLDFALSIDPNMANATMWGRLLWKRRIGSRAWSILGPLIHRLRAVATSSAQTSASNI